MVAIRRHAAWQPLQAYNQLCAPASSSRSTELHRACSVRRTHVNTITLRLKTGAAGHDEGNAIVIRSLHSCTRAPSVSKRHWIVAMVAAAQGVLLHTSRRHVSRKMYAAECRNNRHWLASKR